MPSQLNRRIFPNNYHVPTVKGQLTGQRDPDSSEN